jgi:hypothetical protein
MNINYTIRIVNKLINNIGLIYPVVLLALMMLKYLFVIILPLLYAMNNNNISLYIILSLISFIAIFIAKLILDFLDFIYKFYIIDRILLLLSSILNNKKFTTIFQLIYIYMIFIFCLRYYFRIERPWIIYGIGIIFLLNLYLPAVFFPAFTIEQYIIFLFIFGISLISYDNQGDLFSHFLVNNPNSEFTLGFYSFVTVKQRYYNIIIRSLSKYAHAASLILGNTSMTATGRAALFVGISTGICYGVNAHLQHQHEARENALNRASAESIADAANKLKRIELACNNPNQANVIFEGHPEEYAQFQNTQTQTAFNTKPFNEMSHTERAVLLQQYLNKK